MKTLLNVNLKVIKYSDDVEQVYLNGNYAPQEIKDAVLVYLHKTNDTK